MAIRKYKPTTPGRRGSSVADFAEITRSTPERFRSSGRRSDHSAPGVFRRERNHVGGAAWQTLRADDELWVADDPLRAPDA